MSPAFQTVITAPTIQFASNAKVVFITTAAFQPASPAFQTVITAPTIQSASNAKLVIITTTAAFQPASSVIPLYQNATDVTIASSA